MPCRVSYIPLLRDILLAASPYNWRLRQLIASQIKDLVVLLPIQNVYATLFPLAITLVQDRVAQVRSNVIPGIAKMIQVVLPGYQPTYTLEEINPENGSITIITPQPIQEQDIYFLEAIVKAINALIVSDIYIFRQIWAELALHLLKEIPFSTFEHYFLNGIIQLTSDPITNVRVKIAELLTGWEIYSPNVPWSDENQDNKEDDIAINPWKQLLLRDDIKQCIIKLSNDDRDVYYPMKKIQPLYPEIQFTEISCRGMKMAPGGKEPNDSKIGSVESKTEVQSEMILDNSQSYHNQHQHQHQFQHQHQHQQSEFKGEGGEEERMLEIVNSNSNHLSSANTTFSFKSEEFQTQNINHHPHPHHYGKVDECDDDNDTIYDNNNQNHNIPDNNNNLNHNILNNNNLSNEENLDNSMDTSNSNETAENHEINEQVEELQENES